MSTVRRAGFAGLADGRHVTWSVADGRRGRRWRTVTTDPLGVLESALLLELAPDGALSKVELAGSHGLASLHPEGRVLHGNVVTSEGVRHLRLDWSAEHVLLLEGSVVAAAAATVRIAPDGAGDSRRLPAVVVRTDLHVEATEVTVERLGRTSVGLELDGGRRVIELDEDGIPAPLRSAGEWTLELD